MGAGAGVAGECGSAEHGVEEGNGDQEGEEGARDKDEEGGPSPMADQFDGVECADDAEAEGDVG